IDQRAEIIPARDTLASFPLTMDEWVGRRASLAPDVLQALMLTDYILADYGRAGDRAPVNFYVAYYASQRVGTTTHSPSNCIPGGGWQITSSSVRAIPLANGNRVNLTRLVIHKGEDAELVYYWFDERGRQLTETYIAKWYLLVDSIMMHRTDGALIRLVTPLARGENEEAGDSRLSAFLNEVDPHLAAFIPGPSAANSVAAGP
ncbi:MAG: EpsI family protein, partial [Pseudomonadota bacterium]|nr:EpsI family protein [Pseudomonadota bacterium]